MERTPSPGPDAHRAFRTGIRAAAIAALGVVGLLYWAGLLDAVSAACAVVLLVPVFLVFVATALSKWLGFAPDATDLRPVYRDGTAGSRNRPR